MREMSRLEKERPFCEGLKCHKKKKKRFKSIHCPDSPYPRQVVGEDGETVRRWRGFFLFFVFFLIKKYLLKMQL